MPPIFTYSVIILSLNNFIFNNNCYSIVLDLRLQKVRNVFHYTRKNVLDNHILLFFLKQGIQYSRDG